MKIPKIIVKRLPHDPNGYLSNKIVSRCYFCQKVCEINTCSFDNLHKLSGYKEFFCDFCTRNGFNNKSNRNVIILTFKNVFNYLRSKNFLWESQIKDIVEKHKIIGMENPLFYYDDASLLWYINFAKVGESKRTLSIERVYKTTNLILESLNIKNLAPEIELKSLSQKYFDAINLFHIKRYRPKNKKILSPKISNAKEQNIFF